MKVKLSPVSLALLSGTLVLASCMQKPERPLSYSDGAEIEVE